MDNPVLAEMISDLPFLLDSPDIVQLLLDHTHARIDHYAVRIDEAEAQIEELREMQRVLRETRMTTDEDIESVFEAVVAGYEAFLRQRRNLTQVLAFLLVVRAGAYAKSRSRLVPGILLSAASAAVVPGFRTFVRFSVLMLGFLFASDQPRRDG